LKKLEDERDNKRFKFSIDSYRDLRGATPLHWACAKGSEDILQYLIAFGSDINAQDFMGITPLHLAVKISDENRSTRMFRILLIKGADRNIRDKLGRRPIDLVENCRMPKIK
jgi:uncharacterized protein